jgi:DNA-binding response OmpR family regulator
MSETSAPKPLVLFVDDMPDLTQMVAIGTRLYETPFDAAFADSRESALRVIRDRRPAAVILDVNLIGETGIAIAEDLRENYPLILKAVLTAYDMSVVRAAASEYGMEVWGKPITMQELISKVKALLATPPALGRPVLSHAVNIVKVLAAAAGLFGGAHVHKVH